MSFSLFLLKACGHICSSCLHMIRKGHVYKIKQSFGLRPICKGPRDPFELCHAPPQICSYTDVSHQSPHTQHQKRRLAIPQLVRSAQKRPDRPSTKVETCSGSLLQLTFLLEGRQRGAITLVSTLTQGQVCVCISVVLITSVRVREKPRLCFLCASCPVLKGVSSENQVRAVRRECVSV